MKINELNNGDKLKGPLLISRFVRGVTQNGAPYLSITFQDSTGEIEGKMWDVKPETEAVVKAGVIAEVGADALLYRQSLQLRVQELSVEDQSGYDVAQFVNASKYTKEFLKSSILEFVALIENDVLHQAVEGMLAHYGDDFYVYPAATRNHHNFVGGLASHVYTMCKTAIALCEIYPIYNRDLILAAVILHDMGKIEEYNAPVLSEYTAFGKLLGHISIVHAQLLQVAIAQGTQDTEEMMLLRHCLLAHHGQLEYGSPVMPLVKEAELLSFIDNIDARSEMFDRIYGQLGDGEFSPRTFALENRSFYKAKGVK